MTQSLAKFLHSTILSCYFALVVVTPLLMTTQTSELFEVPKMIFVYFFAAVILTLTAIKFIFEKKVRLPVDLLTGAFVIFLLAQIASTAGSIDRFTSIFGYPSRLNGGLLSGLAYFVIFTGALINLNRQNAKKLISASILSAFVVALWGIPGHFGRDPNCFVLTGNLNSTCWQQEFDPAKRIFSTLGQPNWLASYLVLILPLSVSQIFMNQPRARRLLFATVALTIFIAFIFTNSRAGLAGFVVSVFAFIILLGTKRIQKNLKIFLALLVPGIIIISIFGQQLILRISEIISPGTSAGTESGHIRLIVWQGAIEVAKQNLLLGTGPETFAYSYYKVRPLEHNQTTEWNFFYNKAHNEFLNYLANIGLFGLASFLVFLSAALFKIAQISKTSKEQGTPVLASAVFSAITGYQSSIFFGFGVVTTSLLTFVLIAWAMTIGRESKFKEINLTFFKKDILQITAAGAVGIFGLYLVTFAIRLFLADVFANRAKNASWENPQALLVFDNALAISPVKNPFYLSDAANAFANYSATSQEETAAATTEQAKKLAQEALEISPQNIITARRIANVYILLSGIDENFYNEARNIGKLITGLAPTDPQSYLTFAKIQIATEQNEEAKNSLQKALDLKPDYLEAKELLEQLKNQKLTPDK